MASRNETAQALPGRDARKPASALRLQEGPDNREVDLQNKTLTGRPSIGQAEWLNVMSLRRRNAKKSFAHRILDNSTNFA